MNGSVEQAPIGVIFICKGNRLRSPLAARFAQEVAKQMSLGNQLRFSSAGLNPHQSGIEGLMNKQVASQDPVCGQIARSTMEALWKRRRSTKALLSLGIHDRFDPATDYSDLQTPPELTVDMLAQNRHAICFTNRQYRAIHTMVASLPPEALKPQVRLLTKAAGFLLGGEIADPNTLIARANYDNHTLVARTILNCLWAHEYGLAVQVVKAAVKKTFSSGGSVADSLNSYQARRIQYCVTLTVRNIARKI